MADPERTTTIHKGPNDTADIIGDVPLSAVTPTGKPVDGWRPVIVSVQGKSGSETIRGYQAVATQQPTSKS